MPFQELVQYLLSVGDAVDRMTDGELWTVRRKHYVRSKEGQVMTGRRWEPKFIWVRV